MSSDDELPTVEMIHTNHDEIVEAYDLAHHEIRDRFADMKLERLLEEAKEFDDEFQKAAHMLLKIPKIHVYEDGNKRTAFLTVVEYLDRHNLEPAKTGEEAEKVMKARQRYSLEEIAEWLETGEIDREKLR